MAEINERPIIFRTPIPLALGMHGGRGLPVVERTEPIFASGRSVSPLEIGGKTFVPPDKATTSTSFGYGYGGLRHPATRVTGGDVLS